MLPPLDLMGHFLIEQKLDMSISVPIGEDSVTIEYLTISDECVRKTPERRTQGLELMPLRSPFASVSASLREEIKLTLITVYHNFLPLFLVLLRAPVTVLDI